jgi:hypothetical protein
MSIEGDGVACTAACRAYTPVEKKRGTTSLRLVAIASAYRTQTHTQSEA